MSVRFVMRAIPQDCELTRLAQADAPGLRSAMYLFMFEASTWRNFPDNEDYAPVRRFRDAHPELVELYLDAGPFRHDHVAEILLGMAAPPVTSIQKELAELIQGDGRLLFDPPQYPALVPASRVAEVARFLDTLDPSLDEDNFPELLVDLKTFYHRAASVPGLAVVVSFW